MLSTRQGKEKKGNRRSWGSRHSGKSAHGEEEEEQEQERPNLFENLEVEMGEEKWESPDMLMKKLRRARSDRSHFQELT